MHHVRHWRGGADHSFVTGPFLAEFIDQRSTGGLSQRANGNGHGRGVDGGVHLDRTQRLCCEF